MQTSTAPQKSTVTANTDRGRPLSTAEAARLIGISSGTLSNWRSARTGPRFYKVGTRKVIYYLDDVSGFIESGAVKTY